MVYGEMPEKEGYFRELAKRKKIELIRDFRAKLKKLKNERPATELLSGIFLFARICQEYHDKRKVMVLVSDMRQFTREIDENMITQDVDRAFTRVKSQGLIPDMEGIDVYCMGVSTARMNVKKWQALRDFWQKFFSAAGANLRRYDIGRNWSVD
jgi:hypothetical protein